MAKSDITFEIQQNIGELSTAKSGWIKELNLISWNNGEPKFDIREWSPDHTKMGKGVTFTREEIFQLRELIDNIEE